MKRENKNLLISTLVAIVTFIVLSFSYALTACEQKGMITIPKEEYTYLQYMCNKAYELDELAASSNDILHCVWLDNPSYVEDVLNEYDEFIYADSLRNGDWEDTFEFWSKEDSIRYYASTNKQRREAIKHLFKHE